MRSSASGLRIGAATRVVVVITRSAVSPAGVAGSSGVAKPSTASIAGVSKLCAADADSVAANPMTPPNGSPAVATDGASDRPALMSPAGASDDPTVMSRLVSSVTDCAADWSL